ncbi:MAG TPA: hypothetical protein VLQ89_00990, partial [Candidatus Binatia bacterium]|nr:hypothetical protein [Candidatus Binatia bacterium]
CPQSRRVRKGDRGDPGREEVTARNIRDWCSHTMISAILEVAEIITCDHTNLVTMIFPVSNSRENHLVKWHRHWMFFADSRNNEKHSDGALNVFGDVTKLPKT